MILVYILNIVNIKQRKRIFSNSFSKSRNEVFRYANYKTQVNGNDLGGQDEATKDFVTNFE